MDTRQHSNNTDTPANEPDTVVEQNKALGIQIRRLRQQRHMTLQQLAEAAGLSTAMISKVETGNGNPSISSLQQIARALGVPTAILFTQEVDDQDAVSVNHKRVYSFGGVSYTVVVSPASNDTKFLLVEAEPGAERGTPLFPHDPHAGYEQGMVLAGEMELTVSGRTYVLGPGDTISFPSQFVHSWRNCGDTPMKAAWTISQAGDTRLDRDDTATVAPGVNEVKT